MMKSILTVFIYICFLLQVSGCSASDSDHKPKPKPKPPVIETPGEYDVFLLIGQSNMAGRGVLIDGDLSPIDGVYLLDASGKVEVASNPLNKYSTIRKDLSLQGMNPGYGFAKKIHSVTGRKVLLVVNARGGTSINEWGKGRDYYNEAVKRAEQAQKFGNLVAILWHQGESDSSAPSTYLAKLNAIVVGLRADLKVPAVPFIAGEIAQWHSNESKFNPVIRQIKTVVANSDYVSSAGAGALIDHNDPHFNRDGQILLGERYADKVLKICYNK